MSIQRETPSPSTLDVTQSVTVTQSIIAARSPNKLLASLPSDEYERIAAHLRRVPMRPKHILHKQDAPIEMVYFPGGGACALVKTAEDGRTIEIGAIGDKGATVFLGMDRAPCDVVVQMTGPYAESMPLTVLTREMERRGALYERITTYTEAFVGQLMQMIACSSLHSAEKRCARWLLTACDRAGQDTFPFTHESMATLLGLRRPTVTIVIGSLAAAGLIQRQRGVVTVLDRAGLERRSCECYHVMRNRLEGV